MTAPAPNTTLQRTPEDQAKLIQLMVHTNPEKWNKWFGVRLEDILARWLAENEVGGWAAVLREMGADFTAGEWADRVHSTEAKVVLTATTMDSLVMSEARRDQCHDRSPEYADY